jgi:hypothetical protein
MKTFNSIRNERGFVLLAVYVAVIFVTVFSMVLFARHRAAIQATERYQNRILAFNAAESGIDFALRELATNSSLRTQTATETHTSSYTPMEQNEYRFIVSPVAGRSDLRRIDSKGCAPNCTNTSRAFQTSDIAVYCRLTAEGPPSSLFTYGVYAKDSITMSGNATFDSYNSNYGAYGGSNRSSTGDMAVNSTLSGRLSLSGNAKIKGNAYVGYNGIPNTVITTTGNSSVTGSRSNLAENWSNYASPTLPETVTNTTLSVSGNNTRTLTAGTYHVPSISVSGNGKIVTTGAVVIYVDGAISISGNGILVTNNHPANLLLYSMGSSNVSISGNGSFYGGVYAPNSSVTATGNGDVFGAVIAKTYTQSGNGSTHFDLAMKEIPGGVDPNQTQIVRVKAWQEMNSLAWDTGQTV